MRVLRVGMVALVGSRSCLESSHALMDDCWHLGGEEQLVKSGRLGYLSFFENFPFFYPGCVLFSFFCGGFDII